MAHFPLSFFSKSETSSGMQNTWTTEASGFATKAAIPTEFSGPGGEFSPEDFYALALTNCFIATFKVIAEKSSLDFSNLKAAGELIVDRENGGAPWMKSFLLKVDLNGCADKEKAERLLNKASQSCLVLNSVKTEKNFEFKIN